MAMAQFFFLFIFLSISSLLPSILSSYQYNLSMCAIFHDETPYLKEWIEFHKLVGFEHFYLCSNNNTDNFKEVLEPYIKSGLVELKEFYTDDHDHSINIQCKYYTEVIKKARKVSKWVAFLDIDEFLFPVENISLPEFLKYYDDCAGLVVNWQVFGTSYVDKIPPNRLMIEMLTRCSNEALDNLIVKTIVKPEHVRGFDIEPYFAIYAPGYFQVNTDRLPVKGFATPYVQVNKLRINHYLLRDGDYFYNKILPYSIKAGLPINHLIEQSIMLNKDSNDLILRYVTALRQAMRL